MKRRIVLGGLSGLLAGCTVGADSSTDDCPTVPDASETVCNDDAPVALTASDRSVSLPEATVRFELHNRSDESIGLTVSNWSLYERTTEGWESVVSPTVNPMRHLVGSDEAIQWEVVLDSEEAILQSDSDATSVRIGDVSPGTYAFVVRRTVEPDTTAYAATFDVVDE